VTDKVERIEVFANFISERFEGKAFVFKFFG